MLGWVDTRQTHTWKELLLAFRRQKSGRLNYTLKTSSTCKAVHYQEVLAFVYTSLAHSMDQFGTITENTRMAKITLWADLILKWLSFANTDRQMLSLYGQNRRGRGRGSKCRFMQTLCPIYPHWHLYHILQEYFISHFYLLQRIHSNLSQIGKYASGVSRSQLESQVGSSEAQLCFFRMLIGPTCDRCLTLSVSQ